MTNEEKIFAALHSFNITLNKINNLFKTFGKPSVVLNAIETGDMRLIKLLDSAELNTLKSKLTKDFINKVAERLEQLNIFVVTPFSQNVPKRIGYVFERCGCYGLFCRGSLDCLKNKTCAIVGSRTADAYGKRVTSEFASTIASAGATIVSGLAAGVDSIAHNEALNNNAKTIAVLGGGFNNIYPSFNAGLANKIVESGGLLITEYAPQVQVQNYHFPVRNRIIAAISDAVVITQFKIKSGAMHTKNYAVDYGVDLFIPVADIYSKSAAGNIATIGEYPETATVSPNRVLSFLGLKLVENSKYDELEADEIKIVKILGESEKHFDDIVKLSGFSAQKVNVLLTTLKISGIIKELSGNFFSL